MLEPGAPADLLIFKRDPTRDLSALSSLQAVIADGRLHSKESHDGAVARYRGYFNGSMYDAISMFMAKRAAQSRSGLKSSAPG